MEPVLDRSPTHTSFGSSAFVFRWDDQVLVVVHPQDTRRRKPTSGRGGGNPGIREGALADVKTLNKLADTLVGELGIECVRSLDPYFQTNES
jgi:hypothetical protein